MNGEASVIVEGGSFCGLLFGVSVSSFQFPPCLQFFTSACLLNESIDFLDTFCIGEELWKGVGPASDGKVPLVCVCVKWAVKEDVFYCL